MPRPPDHSCPTCKTSGNEVASPAFANRPRQGARCIPALNALSRNRPPVLAVLFAGALLQFAQSSREATLTVRILDAATGWPTPAARATPEPERRASQSPWSCGRIRSAIPIPRRPSPSCSAPRTGPKATPSSPTDPSTSMAPFLRRAPARRPTPRHLQGLRIPP